MTEITIKGYTRRGKNGKMVSVKSYTRRVGRKGVHSPKRSKSNVYAGEEFEAVAKKAAEKKPVLKYSLAKMTVAEAAEWDKAARKYKHLSAGRLKQLKERKKHGTDL